MLIKVCYIGFDLKRPEFDSLRRFVVNELSIMRSEYAQTFFESNNKETFAIGTSGSQTKNSIASSLIKRLRTYYLQNLDVWMRHIRTFATPFSKHQRDRSIACGRRNNYRPCWDVECKSLN